jgi:hypothetical protein
MAAPTRAVAARPVSTSAADEAAALHDLAEAVDRPPDLLVGVLDERDCNSTAGSAFDAHAERREAVHSLLAGRGPDRAVRAEFKVGDVVTRGNLYHVGDAFLMVGVPRANNPKDIAETTRTLDALAAKGAGGQIGFRLTESVSLTRARLSWVRAAYLAAFAALGWRSRSWST